MKIYVQYSRKHRNSFHIYLKPLHKIRNLSSAKLQENEIQESLVSYNPQETLRKFCYEPKLTYKTVLQDLQRNTFDRGWDVISPTMQWSAFERPSHSLSFQIRNTYFTRKIILRYLFWYVLYEIWSIYYKRELNGKSHNLDLSILFWRIFYLLCHTFSIIPSLYGYCLHIEKILQRQQNSSTYFCRNFDHSIFLILFH